MRRVAPRALLLLLTLACCAHAADRKPVKNVIVLISDGCGYKQIEAASLYEYGALGRQPYEQRGWVKLAVSTYSDGGSYDPAKFWADPEYPKLKPTDSAAAATALSTGVKTYNGAIGMGPDHKPVKHALEWAEERGKATGVVTSVPLSHATPAGFVAHSDGRGAYEDIAKDMLLRSAADVVMGAGNPGFDGNGKPRDKAEFKYVGGESTWAALQAGTAGGDADGDGKADPWTLIQTREQFEALATGKLTAKRVLGVPQVSETLQQGRGKDKPRNEGVPSLATMAQGALQVLGQDPDGFFLMIEGGAIDWTGHANRLDRLVEEEPDFNHTVAAVVAWVEQHSNWNETLVIVTGDHETGYLTAPVAAGKPDLRLPLVNQGRGKLPGAQYNSTNHTNSLLPVYARGAYAERLRARATHKDPVRGPYVDNTDVAQVVIEALQGR